MPGNKQFFFGSQGGELLFQDTEIPEPSPEQVLIKVAACGLCHSDVFTKFGAMGCQFPCCPGHEVAGTVVKTGAHERAQVFKAGDKVGVGWHGYHCGVCEACADGDFILCEKHKVTGIHIQGGYQQYMVADCGAVARVPDGMDLTQAAPLLCAGVTTFNALRHNPGKKGGVVAVQGLGGLGHLGVQFAAKMGYNVVVVSRDSSKKEQAMALGAKHYISCDTQDAAAELMKLGGASVALTTVFNAKAMEPMVKGLGRNGTLVVLGADSENIPVGPFDLIAKRASVRGHPSGTAKDSQDCMEFAQANGVKVQTVVFPFDKAPEAFASMMDGKFRVVLEFPK